jgi:hypothetical protein
MNCRQLQGGEAPDQGLCPWAPLGAKPPDPHINYCGYTDIGIYDTDCTAKSSGWKPSELRC